MSAEPVTPTSENVRVVYAVVCSKCESVIKEDVHKRPVELAKSLCKSDADFFAYKDSRFKAEYRSLSYVNGCRFC